MKEQMEKRREDDFRKKKRRSKRKWKKFLKTVRMGILLMFCIFLFAWIRKNVLFKSTQRTSEQNVKTNQLTDQMRYELIKPELLEGEAIRKRIGELCEKYLEFQDIYDNYEKYPEELLAALCNSPEMIDFVKGYLEASGEVTGGLTEEEKKEKFPLLMQWDKRWGYAPYGDNNLALSGCAPTCLSMVIVGLTGNGKVTPDVVGNYAMEQGYYKKGVGTTWSIMTEAGPHFGVKGEEIPLNKNTVVSELNSGHPVICSMRPGDFTSVGHFIVLVGTQDGKILVNDPNSGNRSHVLWDYETLEWQIKNLWVFCKK